MSEGFIALHRRIRKHWIWKDPRFQWWIDMLMSANWNHEPQKVVIGDEIITCGRGQVCKSVLTWQKEWLTTREKVRGFFRLLESDQMITINTTNKTTIITICNYDDYNSPQPRKKPSKNQQTTNENPQYNKGNKENNTTSKEVVYTEQEREGFMKFKVWIDKEAPQVAKMKVPFTIDQYLKLRKKIPDGALVKKILMAMDNWVPLLEKNRYAYRTFLTWAKKELEK